MYNRADVPSEFQYPQGGLFPLRGMLTAKDINNPNNKNLEGSASAALSNVDSRPLSPSARSPSSYPTYASTPSWAIWTRPRWLSCLTTTTRAPSLGEATLDPLSSALSSVSLLCLRVELARPTTRILPSLPSWNESGSLSSRVFGRQPLLRGPRGLPRRGLGLSLFLPVLFPSFPSFFCFCLPFPCLFTLYPSLPSTTLTTLLFRSVPASDFPLPYIHHAPYRLCDPSRLSALDYLMAGLLTVDGCFTCWTGIKVRLFLRLTLSHL